MAFALVFMPNVYAQKVKVDKKIKTGVSLNAGMLTYSIEDFSISPGILFGGNFVATAPLTKKAENRWIGEFSIGLDYCSNSVEKNNRRSSKDNEGFFEIPIGIRFRYILNPLGTRGFWYVYPGMTVSGLTMVPMEKSTKVNKSTSKYVGTEAGMSIGAECGVGYATRHLGLSVGPFIKIGTKYSSKDSGASPALYGGYATLYYMF